ncbi:MAG: hypothetical protein J6D33_02195, partial [Turicibacter sp.]|nr:hypothetical protein [Turicibacter sp.]
TTLKDDALSYIPELQDRSWMTLTMDELYDQVEMTLYEKYMDLSTHHKYDKLIQVKNYSTQQLSEFITQDEIEKLFA